MGRALGGSDAHAAAGGVAGRRWAGPARLLSAGRREPRGRRAQPRLHVPECPQRRRPPHRRDHDRRRGGAGPMRSSGAAGPVCLRRQISGRRRGAAAAVGPR